MNVFFTDEIKIITIAGLCALCIIFFSVLGYMFFEGWGFFNALYQTVITISTVGFMEVEPISRAGRVMTIFTILFSITLLTYFFSEVVTIMVEGRINKLLRGRKMENKINRLKDHFIILGYGKMGSQIAYEFKQLNVPFVVMDINPQAFEHENTDGLLWITGDATKEEDLLRCGIQRARGLVSVLSDDQYNVYAVLTARGLNSTIRIVTRADEYESERKLKRAGADHVVSPFKIGGSRIVSVMLRPSITHFLDGLSRAEEIRLTLIEVEIERGSELEGKTIGDTGITNISESIIVGLRRPTQPIVIRPPIDTRLQAGDQLVLMGQIEALNKVEFLTRIKT